MEHTITANGIRQGRPGGLVLSQLQIGLAAGCALVACLTAFGGGVIVGMWYKASEQVAPLSASVTTPATGPAAAGADATPQTPAEQPVTFYSTLTGNQAAYAPLTPQPLVAAGAGQTAAPDGGAAGPLKVVASPGVATPAPRDSAASSVRTASTPTPKATAVPALRATKTEADGRATRAAAVPEVRKPVKATPPQKPAPTVPAAATPAPQVARSTPAVPPAAAGKATAGTDYSVQVGSFGSSEQAERLRTNLAQKGYPVRVQLSEVPGQGLRYRVRVGTYADRASADQSAHHLTAQEQVPAIVAGKN